MNTVLKPGYKTTEFAVTVLTIVGLLVSALAEHLTPHYAAFASSVAAGAYALSRGIAKAFPPKGQNPPASG